MTSRTEIELDGELLDDNVALTLAELCRACDVSEERVLTLVEEGIVEPLGEATSQWQFRAVSLHRVRCAVHLERDLGVNPAGAALAVELLEELNVLRERVRRLGG